MNMALVFFWAVVGWAGMMWLRRGSSSVNSWWFIDRIVGIVAGALGGYLFSLAWSMDTSFRGGWIGASAIGAFVASVVISDIYFAFVPRLIEAREMKTVKASE